MYYIFFLALTFLSRAEPIPHIPRITSSSFRSHSSAAQSEVAQTYRNVKDFLDEFKVPRNYVRLPQIVVAGIESAGKSSLLAYLVGIPLSFTSVDTGTRCPVQYELIRDVNVDVPSIQIAKEVLPAERVAARVKQHMEALDGRFSDEPLKITVTSKDVENMIFIDLPGLKPNSDNKEQKVIREMQAKYVRDPSFSVVAVVKCTESMATLQDIVTLEDVFTNTNIDSTVPRADWKKNAVIVVNRLNDHLPNFPSPRKANDFFKKAAEDAQSFKALYFVNLKPPKGGNVFHYDDAKFGSQHSYLKELTDLEAKWFSNEKANIAKSVAKKKQSIPWDPTNDEMFGLQRVKDEITHLWLDRFVEELPSLIANLKDLLKKDNAQEQHLQERIRYANTTGLQDNLKNFIVDLLQQYKGLLKGQAVKTHDGNDITTLKSQNTKPTRNKVYQPSVHGKTMIDEYNSFPCLKPEAAWISEKLPNLVVPEELFLHREWTEKRIGKASFQRSFKVLSLLIFNRDFEDVGPEDINNMAAGQDDEDGKVFPTKKIMFQLAQHQLHSLANGISWYLEFLESIYLKMMDIPWEYMTANQSSDYFFVGQLKGFKKAVMKEIKRNMHEKLAEVNALWGADVRRLARNPRLDDFAKLGIMLKTVPVPALFVQEHHLKVESTPEPEEHPEIFLKDGDYLKLQSRTDADRLKRDTAISDLLFEWRRKDSAMEKKGLTTLDLVEGGHVAMAHMEKSSVKYNYIKDTAYAFYVNYVVTLVKFLENSLEEQFFDFVLQKDGVAPASQSFEKIMTKFVEDMGEDGLRNFLPMSNLTAIQAELEEVRNKSVKMDALLDELIHLDQKQGPSSKPDQQVKATVDEDGSSSVSQDGQEDNGSNVFEDDEDVDY